MGILNMKSNKSSIKKAFIIIFIVQIILVIVSGGLNRTLEIGFEQGKFVIRHQETPYDLQDEITWAFQPDEYFEKSEDVAHIYGSERLYSFFAKIFGKASAINTFRLLRMILFIDLILIIIAFLVNKRVSKKPSKSQILFEQFYQFFEDFVADMLGKKYSHFTPYILTLFIFIFLCNITGMIPIPGFFAPTQNLNVPLGLGIMAVSLVHYMGIKKKGILKYLQGYAEPIAPLAPLNVVGEISKAVSISFRLFGNILGGSIIILVVSSLVKFVILPIGLELFFGLFVGTLQAFVFTMLALTYISVEIVE